VIPVQKLCTGRQCNESVMVNTPLNPVVFALQTARLCEGSAISGSLGLI